MGPMKLDEAGHIIIDDSMSDELKEKIAAYNALADSGEEEEVEVSDAEADAYTEDSIDTGELEDDPVIEHNFDEKELAAEEINDLNDMFS